MPTGKVKWFDPAKGFGFLSQDDGEDVYVHADDLPAGAAATLKAGAKVEFSIKDGRRGPQAWGVHILEAPASVSRNIAAAKRRKPEEMVIVVENAVKLLDDIREGYEHGRAPSKDQAKKISPALRLLADEFELS